MGRGLQLASARDDDLDRQAAGRRSRPGRRGAAPRCRGNVRLRQMPSSTANRGSANTSASARLSPPSTSPAQRRRSGTSSRAVVVAALRRTRCAGCPAAGRNAVGTSRRLPSGPAGRRGRWRNSAPVRPGRRRPSARRRGPAPHRALPTPTDDAVGPRSAPGHPPSSARTAPAVPLQCRRRPRPRSCRRRSRSRQARRCGRRTGSPSRPAGRAATSTAIPPPLTVRRLVGGCFLAGRPLLTAPIPRPTAAR